MTERIPSRPQRALDPGIRHAMDERLASTSAEDQALLARVRQRVLDAIQNQEEPAPGPGGDFKTVRAGDDAWKTVSPGIDRKVLWSGNGTQSAIVWLAPGAKVDAHTHLADEGCIVLEGSLRIGQDLVLYPGDFHIARRGSHHEPATTDTGALVYLRSAEDAGSSRPPASAR